MARDKGFRLDMGISKKDLALLNKKLDKLNRMSKTGLDKALKDTSTKIVEIAKSRVVVDTGQLKGSIRNERTNGGYEVFANKKYAPYIEFGTGGNVKLDDAVELGIPPQTIYNAFKGKREGNMQPQPFFYSSARMAYDMLLTKLKTDFKRFVR